MIEGGLTIEEHGNYGLATYDLGGLALPSTRWKLEPHTAAKHEILRQYLNAWFPILGSQHERVVFLDGFAGPGIYEDGEPGSPIIALRTLLEHAFFPPHVLPVCLLLPGEP